MPSNTFKTSKGSSKPSAKFDIIFPKGILSIEAENKYSFLKEWTTFKSIVSNLTIKCIFFSSRSFLFPEISKPI